jgi:hypothetical protein
MCFNFFGTSLHTPIREGEVLYLSFFILLRGKINENIGIQEE